MNYQKLYNNIIINRQNNLLTGYTEKHHIIPKSLGGSNKKKNIVKLSAREHFICHLLLTKMYKQGTFEWIKMTKAFMNMFRQNNKQQRYINSKSYEYYKYNFSLVQSINQSGKANSQYGKHWIINPITKEKKFLFPKDIQEYLDNGWIYGRTTKRAKISILDKTIDKLNLNEEEKQNLKQRNKEIRKRRRQKRKEKLGKCYLFTNNKTGQKKVISITDIQKLSIDWFSPFYVLDTNKQYIEQQLLDGKTIRELSIEFNVNYDNFYTWYKKYGKDIKIKLQQHDQEKQITICPICGKSFLNKKHRMFCSHDCWKSSIKNRCWIRKDCNLKHVQKENLNVYLQNDWIQVVPIFNKSFKDWKIVKEDTLE